MILVRGKQEREVVERLRALSTQDAGLAVEVLELKREVAELETQKSRLEEDFARRERELKHMVGLEQRRVEAERAQQATAIEQAEQGAVLKVREENLQAERKRFEEQLAFNTQRFATMEAYLKNMLADILKRLPNVNVKMTGQVSGDR